MHLVPQTLLRPFQESDETFFATLASDERVTRFIGTGQAWEEKRIRERVQDALRQKPVTAVGAARWFVATEESTPVGIVVSSRKESGVEIGYWVSPDHWGRGIAGSIVDRALKTVPQIFDSEQLIACVAPANIASAKILTRRGFALEEHRDGVDIYTMKSTSPKTSIQASTC